MLRDGITKIEVIVEEIDYLKLKGSCFNLFVLFQIRLRMKSYVQMDPIKQRLGL